ncbi:MAG: hypothetical protein GY861_17085 [bacterium]|nr:hypothetical protein [bacterium]
MMEGKCKRCKKAIPEGRMCPECKELDYQEKLDKRKNRQEGKHKQTREYGITQVKKYAEGRTWAGSHCNSFRATVRGGNAAESEAHIRAKFERWLFHRQLGRDVFCELPLKPGLGRPDLIIVDKGFIWVEEIVMSESEKSLIDKSKKYPWPIKSFIAKDLNNPEDLQ